MPTVVQFGAGAIGRGFVGQLWTDAGYEVVFVDVDQALIAQLNERRSYPLRLVKSAGTVENCHISPVRAVDGGDTDAVAKELASCEFAVTAVGVNVFSHLARTIAEGIELRFRTGNKDPLNVICCENQVHAGAMLRSAVKEQLARDEGVADYFANHVAFVDASVGRMVPPPTAVLLKEDPLLLLTEPYYKLPIDGSAWIGSVPYIHGLAPSDNFAGYVARKLFTHNGGHAALAYHGYQAGLEFIWQAAEDPRIIDELRGFWAETGAALVAAFGFDTDEQRRHEEDLLQRFRNRALADTIQRVARDPLRKLRPEDRLVGAGLLCVSATMDAPTNHASRAIAAALRYSDGGDPSAVELQRKLALEGLPSVLWSVCGLEAGSRLAVGVMDAYAAVPASFRERTHLQ